MNVLGLVLSFVLVIVVVGIGYLLARQKRISSEAVRKFIHIGVSNWWFILVVFFDNFAFALLGPILFTLTNTVAVFSGLANTLGITDRRRNLGLIYFPITLLILVTLGYGEVIPLWASGIGIITMGYGDGLAALIGKRWGTKRIVSRKSVLGTVVMFIVTILVITGFSFGYALPGLWSMRWWVAVIVIAAAASLLEAFTPGGMDNLTVPLGTALLAYLLLGGL